MHEKDIYTCSMSLSTAPVLLRSEFILFNQNRNKSTNQKQLISKLNTNLIHYSLHFNTRTLPFINWRAQTAQSFHRSSNPTWLELNRELTGTITLLRNFTQHYSNKCSLKHSPLLFRHRLAAAGGGRLRRNEAIEKWNGECTD
jgi:hypothetical protein